MKFRPLEDNEVRVLFGRHGRHKNQILSPETIDRLKALGHALGQTGETIEQVVSSPRPRCIRTCMAVLEGMGMDADTTTDERLSDISSEPDLGMDQLKARAASADMGVEAWLMVDPECKRLMDRRGREGSSALRDAVMAKGKWNILASSHGGSRMEVSLLDLLGENRIKVRQEVADGRHPAVKLIEQGQIVELIFRDDGAFVEMRYLRDKDLGME